MIHAPTYCCNNPPPPPQNNKLCGVRTEFVLVAPIRCANKMAHYTVREIDLFAAHRYCYKKSPRECKECFSMEFMDFMGKKFSDFSPTIDTILRLIDRTLSTCQFYRTYLGKRCTSMKFIHFS